VGTNPLLSSRPVVFFDTECLLCNRTVHILLKYDRQQLGYAGLNSTLAARLLPEDLRQQPATLVFYGQGKIYLRSRAAFNILNYLRFPWPLLRIFAILPVRVTDYVYDRVARNRFAWFGRAKACLVPTAEQQSRFFA